ncbi:uncharacterized protein LOC130119354 [Lampris incognitus]|uniref:uncharacterized protein LOC130119354 n=1 Tax=Lampris incognitus TaxID=2546036 RepID=UPI0024B504D7|nr:uncharacterized protein LOC130119354 [Lampris incognitus]
MVAAEHSVRMSFFPTMAVHLIFGLLALSCLGAASEPDCKELLKPLVLDDRSPLYGKWIFYAGTSDVEDFLKFLKTIKTSWIDIAPIADSGNITLRWGDRINENCVLGCINSTYADNSSEVSFKFNFYTSWHDGKYIETCPDCILWADSAEISTSEGTKQGRNLFLYTRTGNLDDSQLEVFKKQAACLNFPQVFHFGGNKDLCPDEQHEATLPPTETSSRGQ